MIHTHRQGTSGTSTLSSMAPAAHHSDALTGTHMYHNRGHEQIEGGLGSNLLGAEGSCSLLREAQQIRDEDGKGEKKEERGESFSESCFDVDTASDQQFREFLENVVVDRSLCCSGSG